MPEEKQSEIEDRAFQDEQYLRDILAAESDLIDEYVRGELSDSARRQFESRFFASAERRRKVEFARALVSVAPQFAVIEENIRPARSPAPLSWPNALAVFLRGLNPAAKFSLAAAALLVVIGGPWLVAESLRLRAELSGLRAEQQSRERQQQALQQQIADEQARREDLSTQLQREREQREHSQQLVGELQRELEGSTAQPPQPAVVSLALWPGISRSGGARPKLVLPQAARRVRIQIGVEPEDEYQSFRAELRAPGGQPIWTRGSLSARRVRAGRAVILNLPASILKAGEYELVLKGVTGEKTTEDVGYHYFDVLKK
ncbi:MAG TPA: hypothetical protein VKC34_16280 [Blastocatellia bacterium]|nr:hypothetical protein [Blastocatellia bacterium]